MNKFLCAVVLVALALPAFSPIAAATPVADNDAAYLALGRVFPEPYECVGFVTWNEFQSGIAYLESKFPDRLKVNVVGTSVGGHEVYQVEVTNEKSATPYEQRRFLYFSGSTHGNERGGAEGQMRVIEDWALTSDPAMMKILDNTVILFNFLNPDGWIAGDISQGGAMYNRGNDNGVDLNREWPVVGWIYGPYSPLSEPESISMYANLTGRVASGQKFYYGADIHGMLVDALDAALAMDPGYVSTLKQSFVDVMMPAGEYTFREMYKQVECAKTVYNALYENLSGSALEQLQSITGTEIKPAMWGACWDALGYTDSGFMGDWLTLHDGLNLTGLDYELMLSHTAPNNVWTIPLEYLHVQSVRTIINNMICLSQTDPKPWVSLPGKVAYLEIPRIAGRDSGAENSTPYDVCPTDFMADLGTFATQPIVPVKYADIVSGKAKIEDYTSLVIIESDAGKDAKYVEAVKKYVENGGNLVLTDGATTMLSALEIVSESDITESPFYAGYIDIQDWSDALVKEVRGTARQTYEPVPLGFSILSDESPVWSVNSDSWTSKGGKVVGTTGGEESATLGWIKMGDGNVSFVGAVLPNPIEDNDHPYGLSSYSPTYSGYQIMINAIGGTTIMNYTPQQNGTNAPDGKQGRGFLGLPGFEASVAIAILAFAAAGKINGAKTKSKSGKR
ncbi:MAG: M14 family zinc carboxypeptidase [Candidatus Thermoplasmatota archaeon]|nr:M14 family zinc carboxypeptidase [Candidatus Thermoplasmatota archaeon]